MVSLIFKKKFTKQNTKNFTSLVRYLSAFISASKTLYYNVFKRKFFMYFQSLISIKFYIQMNLYKF